MLEGRLGAILGTSWGFPEIVVGLSPHLRALLGTSWKFLGANPLSGKNGHAWPNFPGSLKAIFGAIFRVLYDYVLYLDASLGSSLNHLGAHPLSGKYGHACPNFPGV